MMGYRELFPYLRETPTIYLNHAATSPLPTPVVKAVSHYLHERSAGKINFWQEDWEVVRQCREKIAALINTTSDRIALMHNTSAGIQILAQGLPWQPGDEILMIDQEFPANVYPYRTLEAMGVKVRLLPAPDGRSTPELFSQYVSERTRAIVVSAVQFLSGYRTPLTDLRQLCDQYGCWLLVDAIQAVGSIQIDVQQTPVDALVAGGQKWMMSPHGTGFLYISEALQAQLRRTPFSWLSVPDPWDFFRYDQQPVPQARQFEAATLNYPGFYGMEAALDLLLKVSPAAIEQRIAHLVQYLQEQLQEIESVRLYTPEDPELRAGILTVQVGEHEEQAKAVAKFCMKHGLHIAYRSGKIRFSPHFYNTPDEIDRAVRIFQKGLDTVLQQPVAASGE